MKSTPSSAPFLDSSKWVEAAETTDALRTLARSLTRTRAFALFFAVCNKPAERDQLIAMLADALPGKPLHRVELTTQTTDVLDEVCRQVPQPQSPLLVVGLEVLVPSDIAHHPVLERLNLQRPQWPARVPQPVIFWVPQYVLGFLEREAPDFFDWRSDTITFPDLAEDEVDHLRQFIWKPAVDGSLNVESRDARTAELQARLEQTPASTDPVVQNARAGWLRELGNQLAFAGDWEQALNYLQQSRELFEALEDKRSRAITLGDIARLRAAKGEVDAALQLHQEEIAIYEALGDKRSRAGTLGDIARLRAAKGEVDAALQLQAERLQVNRGLGNLDGIGAACFDIARIEIQQQKWQEAFKHLAESYAIMQQTGRLDGICMVGATYGQLLCMAGQREEGLKILTRSRDGFRQLGRADGVQHTEALIAKFSQSVA